MENQRKYPIKVVSNITGLTVHVIRMWEKRYKLVQPERTSSNRRLYSEQDIQRLQLLKKATELGYGIGQIASWDNSELEKLITSLPSAPPKSDLHLESTELNPDLKKILQQAWEAIQTLNASKLESLLMESRITFSQPVILDHLIIPLINQLGISWQDGSIRIYHEHLASIVIRKFLQDQLSATKISPTAPRLVVTTPAGQQHELGALIAGLIAASLGWEVTYLGANLPAEEIVAALKEKNAQSLLLSIVYPPQDPYLEKELSRLRQMVGQNTSILVGGRAVPSYLPVLKAIDAIIFTDFSQLRQHLNSQQTAS